MGFLRPSHTAAYMHPPGRRSSSLKYPSFSHFWSPKYPEKCHSCRDGSQDSRVAHSRRGSPAGGRPVPVGGPVVGVGLVVSGGGDPGRVVGGEQLKRGGIDRGKEVRGDEPRQMKSSSVCSCRDKEKNLEPK